MDEALEKRWQELSEEVLSGMKEWRLAHPTATFRESEEAVRARMSRMEAHLLQESALNSKQTDWAKEPKDKRPICPTCGTALQPGEKRSTWNAPTEPVHRAGSVFFPLDEQLGLTSSSLAPKYEEHLVHVATWMPLTHAADMLERLVGGQVSEATVRRHTDRQERSAKRCKTRKRSRQRLSSPREKRHHTASF